MNDKNGWISDEYHGFIDQSTPDCIEVIGGLINMVGVEV